MARTYAVGGGVGISLGNISPRGAEVNNNARTTTGAVSFMPLYSLTTETIGQEGRRGALMLSIPEYTS
jgi:ribonucleoside-diphosphate reductase alpha chain